MQIIIVQTEIEEAIRAHINRQINVREGMRIDIDLSATRGPEGFKATIDIVPDGSARAMPQDQEQNEPAQEPPQMAQAKSQVQPPAEGRKSPVIRKAAPPKPAEDTPEKESPEKGIDENAQAADVAEVANEAPQEAAQTAADEGETPPTTPGASPSRSLFGGLSKPTNS